MKIVARDTTKEGYGRLMVEFTQDDVRFLGIQIGYSRYGGSVTDDGEALQKFKTLFANQTNAHSICVSQFHAATILKNALKRLDVWFDQAAMVCEDKGEPTAEEKVQV